MDKIDHPLVTWQAKIHIWMEGHDKAIGDLGGEIRKLDAKLEQFEQAKPFSGLAKAILGIVFSIILALGTWVLSTTYDLSLAVKEVEVRIDHLGGG